MDKKAKIYLAGHKGLVGSAIMRELQDQGYTNIIVRASSELNLIRQDEVESFFNQEKPDFVILAAAKVGGIVANNTYRAQFLYENLMIQSNVIHAAYQSGVKKLLFLGSTCIYPKYASQPMKEEDLLTGPLEETNEPYAVAKIAGMKMCENYNRQYGTSFLSVMPTNLYGRNDNYDLKNSHVFAALLRKIHLGKSLENSDWQAIRKDLRKNPIDKVNGNSSVEEILQILKKSGISRKKKPKSKESVNFKDVKESVQVEIWGTGKPKREFMHSADMARACIFVLQSKEAEKLIKTNPGYSWINIGTGEEISIKELAVLLKKQIGFKGKLVFNADKPDGTPRKLTDTSRLHHLGFHHEINLDYGIQLVYDVYKSS